VLEEHLAGHVGQASKQEKHPSDRLQDRLRLRISKRQDLRNPAAARARDLHSGPVVDRDQASPESRVDHDDGLDGRQA
jgi:hypothetical protein